MRKYLPFALPALAIIATQIGCTIFLADEQRVVYVESVENLTYDGNVIRAEELVLSKKAALDLLRELAYLFASNDIEQPKPL